MSSRDTRRGGTYIADEDDSVSTLTRSTGITNRNRQQGEGPSEGEDSAYDESFSVITPWVEKDFPGHGGHQRKAFDDKSNKNRPRHSKTNSTSLSKHTTGERSGQEEQSSSHRKCSSPPSTRKPAKNGCEGSVGRNIMNVVRVSESKSHDRKDLSTICDASLFTTGSSIATNSIVYSAPPLKRVPWYKPESEDDKTVPTRRGSRSGLKTGGRDHAIIHNDNQNDNDHDENDNDIEKNINSPKPVTTMTSTRQPQVTHLPQKANAFNYSQQHYRIAMIALVWLFLLQITTFIIIIVRLDKLEHMIP